MKKTLLSLMILSTLSGYSFSVAAQDVKDEFKSESVNINELKSDGFIKSDFYIEYNNLANESEQYGYLVGLVKEAGHDKVYVDMSIGDVYIPLNAFLMLRDEFNLAQRLVNDGYSKAFETFDYAGSESSDLGIAVEKANYNYIVSVINKVDDINKRFKYNGELGFTLLMIAAYIDNVETYNIVRLLLDNGANPDLLSYNDLSALSIAQEVNNRHFMNAYSDYMTEKASGKNDYEKNNLVPSKKLAEIDRIVSNLNRGMMEEIFENEDYYPSIYTMILNGYSKPANMIIDEMVKRDLFDPNYVDDDGVSLLMMTALADIPGGDVETAVRLIEMGADVRFVNEKGFHVGEATIVKDAYKVFLVLVKNGFDPFNMKASNGMDLYDFAIRSDPIAVNVATIIREFVVLIANDPELQRQLEELQKVKKDTESN